MSDELRERLVAEFESTLAKVTLQARVTQVCEQHTQTAVALALEKAATVSEDHLIYTGPGGFDPAPIQKIIARTIRSIVPDVAKLIAEHDVEVIENVKRQLYEPAWIAQKYADELAREELEAASHEEEK